MELAIFEIMTTAAFITAAIGSIIFTIQKHRFISGSYGRYVFAGLERLCDIIVLIALPVLAGINATQGNYVFASFALIMFLLNLWLFLKRFDDDDHWFNNQWKRLKRGFKKLRQNLANTSPLPSPSSA